MKDNLNTIILVGASAYELFEKVLLEHYKEVVLVESKKQKELNVEDTIIPIENYHNTYEPYYDIDIKDLISKEAKAPINSIKHHHNAIVRPKWKHKKLMTKLSRKQTRIKNK